ncbi:MAG: hypothetical protein KKC18_07665, partial [Chloroflexi bacterium]|nr:hypothetical protein [Chloroflexota bacterium]
MFNIVEKRRWYFIFSAFLATLSIAALVGSAIQFGQPMRLGIDFTGGSIFVLKFDRTIGENDLRAAFSDYGLEGAIIQPRGAPEDNTWQVRTREVTASEVGSLLNALETQVGSIDRDALNFDTVEPAVGGEVARAAG